MERDSIYEVGKLWDESWVCCTISSWLDEYFASYSFAIYTRGLQRFTHFRVVQWRYKSIAPVSWVWTWPDEIFLDTSPINLLIHNEHPTSSLQGVLRSSRCSRRSPLNGVCIADHPVHLPQPSQDSLQGKPPLLRDLCGPPFKGPNSLAVSDLPRCRIHRHRSFIRDTSVMYNLFFLLNHPLLPLFAPQFLWKVAKYAQVMNWGINLLRLRTAVAKNPI